MEKARGPQRLCRLDDIPDGEARGFLPDRRGRDRIFVVRQGGRVHGYLDSCPHHPGARMAWRKDGYLTVDGTRIRCAGHGALFRIDDGLCEQGPCLGSALARVGLVVRAGEILLVAMPSLPDAAPGGSAGIARRPPHGRVGAGAGSDD
ncbi:MAG: (2Fe-2S)-binding protein [Paracoccaceae bacterium]|nr:MAG: (2Fe-2S)-binding protein [Paracoccaceae bacterium]